jgi:hypothetical protein
MGDQAFGARAAFRPRQLHQLERVLDVVDRAQPREQRFAVVLEYVAELDVAQRLAVEQDCPCIAGDESGDHVDQRGLAAAVWPEHGDELPARDVEIESVVNDRLGEMLGQSADGDVGGRRRRGGVTARNAALVRSLQQVLPSHQASPLVRTPGDIL